MNRTSTNLWMPDAVGPGHPWAIASRGDGTREPQAGQRGGGRHRRARPRGHRRSHLVGTGRGVDVPHNTLSVGMLQLDLDRRWCGRRVTGVRRSDAGAEQPAARSGWRPTIRVDHRGELSSNSADVADVAAPCATSLDKARGEIESGHPRLHDRREAASGLPRQGNLSRKLAVDVDYARVASATSCAAASPTEPLLTASGAGNLRAAGRHELHEPGGRRAARARRPVRACVSPSPRAGRRRDTTGRAEPGQARATTLRRATHSTSTSASSCSGPRHDGELSP